MDEAASPGKVERQSRESPGQSSKTCNLGARPMRGADKGDGEVGKAIWGYQTQGEDRGVFTGIIPLLSSDFGEEGCGGARKGQQAYTTGDKGTYRGRIGTWHME